MQAIVTKYHGPTNYRGSRVSARSQAGRIFLSWDSSKDSERNHALAAQAYARKLGWGGKWVGGELPGGAGHCYVCLPTARRKTLKAIVVDSWTGKRVK